MKQIIRAEMWDKMQYLFRNYYDRMVHGTFTYDGTLDKELFKKALKFQLEKVPVLHSKYHNNFIRPYWVVQDFNIDEVVEIKQSKNLDYDIDKFLTQRISIKNKLQMNVAIFECGKKTAVCFILNHMCFDGGDFKYFVTTLCQNYTKLCGGDENLEIKSGSRDYTELYKNLSPEDLKIAKSLYKNVSQTKDKHRFPLTPSLAEDKNRIIKHIIPAEKFLALKNGGKDKGFTVNDIMLAVYLQSLYEIGNFGKDDSVTIPNMIDNRRHIKDGGATTGLTNHTGFMNCTINGIGATTVETLAKVVEGLKDSKEDKFIGLYTLPLLHLAYTIFPQCISEFAIKLGYDNPLMGMSNIGMLNPDSFAFGKLKPIDGFFTGAVKFKPFMQVALTTMYNKVTMTIAICGNDKDEAIVKKFFAIMDKHIDELIELGI